MPTLRSRTIRLAFTNPDLRPQLLPLLAKTAIGYGVEEEEEGALLWRRKYERAYDDTLQSYLDRYPGTLDEMKALLRFWFHTREGNFRDTPFDELPNVKAMMNALFHRRKKMLWDLDKAQKSLDWGSDEMLETLNDIILRFHQEFSSR